MKKFRILYFINAFTTEYFMKANNEEEARNKFRDLKGENPVILSIEEC